MSAKNAMRNAAQFMPEYTHNNFEFLLVFVMEISD